MYSGQIPGKLMLAGEFAVLQNAPALVTAVEEQFGWSFKHHPTNRLVLPDLRLDLDENGLQSARESGHKAVQLYLAFTSVYPFGPGRFSFERTGPIPGSASAALMAALVQMGLRSQDSQAQFAAAHRIHSTVQRGGSGADIATCLLGGVVLFRPNDRPKSWHGWNRRWFAVGDTGVQSDTALILHRFQTALAGDGAMSAMDDHVIASGHLVDQWLVCPESLALDAARQANQTLGALDEQWKLGVFTREINELCDLADSNNIPCRPSGAGGGDCVVAWTRTKEDAAALLGGWVDAGYRGWVITPDGNLL